MKALKKLTRSKEFFVFLLLILVFSTYSNIFNNEMFYDDEELIYKNIYVQNLSFWPKYFTENMVAGAGKLSNMYRPILLLSFATDFAIYKTSPIGFHFTNITLHFVNAVLVFLFIKNISKNTIVAFISSVLFAVHPTQTESVTYISGRTDLLYTLFTLSGLNLALQYLFKEKNIFLFFGLILAMFLLALLSKETAIIVPFLYLFVFISQINQKNRNALIKLVPLIASLLLIEFIYLILRLTIFNFKNIFNFYDTPTIYSENILIRLITFPKLFFEYIKIIFYPRELIFARDIQYVESIFDPFVIAFVLLIIFIYFLFIKRKKLRKIIVFSCAWFFISIAPVSGIIPINSIITEHYLYLPSISIFFLIALSSFAIIKRLKNKVFKLSFIMLLSCIIFILTARSYNRNKDWENPIKFYKKSLAQSPWHVPMRQNLAMTYSEKKMYDLAEKEFLKLIKEADYYPHTHHNLANLYKEIGESKKAENEYLKALKMDPQFHFSYWALADLYKKTDQEKKLEETLLKMESLNLINANEIN